MAHERRTREQESSTDRAQVQAWDTQGQVSGTRGEQDPLTASTDARQGRMGGVPGGQGRPSRHWAESITDGRKFSVEFRRGLSSEIVRENRPKAVRQVLSAICSNLVVVQGRRVSRIGLGSSQRPELSLRLPTASAEVKLGRRCCECEVKPCWDLLCCVHVLVVCVHYYTSSVGRQAQILRRGSLEEQHWLENTTSTYTTARIGRPAGGRSLPCLQR